MKVVENKPVCLTAEPSLSVSIVAFCDSLVM